MGEHFLRGPVAIPFARNAGNLTTSKTLLHHTLIEQLGVGVKVLSGKDHVLQLLCWG